MSKFLREFKEFAVRGNAIDMAVGVIVGGAFGKVVSSIVSDIVMPPIGWLIGGVDFSDLRVKLPAGPLGGEPATINYGVFVQTVIEFLVIALCVFLMVKVVARIAAAGKKKEAQPEAPAAPAAPTREEELLSEIRDLLRQRQSKADCGGKEAGQPK